MSLPPALGAAEAQRAAHRHHAGPVDHGAPEGHSRSFGHNPHPQPHVSPAVSAVIAAAGGGVGYRHSPMLRPTTAPLSPGLTPSTHLTDGGMFPLALGSNVSTPRSTPATLSLGKKDQGPLQPIDKEDDKDDDKHSAVSMYDDGLYEPHTGLSWLYGLPPHLTMKTVLKELMTNCLPAALTTLLFFCNQTVTMMFVGSHLGPETLSHYSVGVSVFNVCGLSICLGLASALDTLSPQSFGRDPDGPELGQLFQRAVLVCIVLASPILTFFYFSEPLLAYVFPLSLAAGVSQFLQMSPVYFISLIISNCMMKSLQGQKLPAIPMIAAFIATALCPVYNYFLTPYGMKGAIAAISAATSTQLVVMFAVAFFHPQVILWRCRWPVDTAVFDWELVKQFLSYGLPSMFSVCTEWWAFEIIVTFAAQLGQDATDAFTIAFNVMLCCYSMPQGTAIAVGVLAGNSLGSNDPGAARSFCHVGMTIAVIQAVTNMALLWFFGEHIFILYTREDSVLDLLQDVLPYMLLFHLGDAWQAVLQGAFRGVGEQDRSAKIVLWSLWIIGVPSSFVFSKYFGLPGVIMGLVIGILVLEVPMLLNQMFRKWDWKELADRACQMYVEEAEQEEEWVRSREVSRMQSPMVFPVSSAAAILGDKANLLSGTGAKSNGATTSYGATQQTDTAHVLQKSDKKKDVSPEERMPLLALPDVQDINIDADATAQENGATAAPAPTAASPDAPIARRTTMVYDSQTDRKKINAVTSPGPGNSSGTRTPNIHTTAPPTPGHTPADAASPTGREPCPSGEEPSGMKSSNAEAAESPVESNEGSQNNGDGGEEMQRSESVEKSPAQGATEQTLNGEETANVDTAVVEIEKPSTDVVNGNGEEATERGDNGEIAQEEVEPQKVPGMVGSGRRKNRKGRKGKAN